MRSSRVHLRSARRPPVVWSLAAPFAAMALGPWLHPSTMLGVTLSASPVDLARGDPGASEGSKGQVDTPDPGVPTALEQALITHVCSATRLPGAVETDAFQDCMRTKLLSLRADFGRDLGRLSGAERRAIDSICSKARGPQGREGYLACLNAQLVSLSNRRSRAQPVPPALPSLPAPSASAPPESSAPPARQASSWSSGLWIGGGAVGLLALAGGVLLAVKARRPSRKCGVCGVDIREPGDLCQNCRHEAAEALRRAATERVDHQRAQEEEQRRQREHLEEQRAERAREEEAARLRKQEEARQWEEYASRPQEETRHREPTPRESPDASQAVFDPYAVLGVPRDASKENILAAYQAARLKYDLEHVAHLSVELQEHYKQKALAVDRAYKMLTE